MAHELLVMKLLGAAAGITKRLDRSVSGAVGVSFAEYQLLSAIETSPGSSATRIALAERVGLTPSGVTRALQPLEKIGMVETKRDERDARRSLAALTDAGRRVVGDAASVVADVIGELEALDRLSRSDRDRFARLLDELGG